jgi:hypothetical protein
MVSPAAAFFLGLLGRVDFGVALDMGTGLETTLSGDSSSISTINSSEGRRDNLAAGVLDLRGVDEGSEGALTVGLGCSEK